MLGLINWRLKVTINDGRAFIGQMLAFDKHMNLVLADCEEFRHVRPKKKPGESEAGPEQEMKRSLGLVILRGETVVSLSVEGPPPVQDDDKKNAVCATPNSRKFHLKFFRASQLPAGPGRGMPAGRGMGMVPPCACCIPALRILNQGRFSLTVTSSFLQLALRHLRDPRCHSRHLACQVHLPVSALLGSVALLLGKTIARDVEWMTC